MSNVSREPEFYRFMVENGPRSDGGKRNYISWLRYITDKYGYVSQPLTIEGIEQIISDLRLTKKFRDVYTSDSSISDIQSALRKYYAFVSTNEDTNEIVDLENILNTKITTSQK